MYTANSMNCLSEAIGMALPGNGTIPAVYSARERLAKEAGYKIMELLEKDIRPRDILTKEAFENALKVAEWLANNPRVKNVRYPGLKGDKYHALAQKYLPLGSSGVVTFEVDGSRADTQRLMDAFQLAKIVVHVADARTCVLHPASMTHRQLTDEQLIAAGISPTTVRFSCGIEHIDDIIADLEQAFKKAF